MEENNDKVNEPAAEYIKSTSKDNHTITFFNSFEEAELSRLKAMASHSHEQRLQNLEIIRKLTYHDKLLPNGQWPPLKRVITIVSGSTI